MGVPICTATVAQLSDPVVRRTKEDFGIVSGRQAAARYGRSAGDSQRRKHAMTYFAADFGGARNRRRLTIHVAPAGKGDGLHIQQVPLRWPLWLVARTGLGGSCRRLGVM